jgi:hypothetical protein
MSEDPTTRLPREAYEDVPSPRRARLLLLVLAMLGLALLAADWSLRVVRYRWHESLIGWPAAPVISQAAVSTVGFRTNELAATKGGDLSRLAGIPSATARFEEPRPAATVTVDAGGYRNLPYGPDTRFRVVVAGDSYMAEGLPLTNMISVRLAGLLDEPVLNRALLGRGPFESVMRWIERDGLESLRGGVLVWGFVERDISGEVFAGLVYQLHVHRTRGSEVKPATVSSRVVVRWHEFAPSRLKTALPNSSALAQASRRVWHRIRYAVFGAWSPDVVVLTPPAPEQPLLGYRLSLEAMYWPPEVRNLDQVVWATGVLRDYLAGYDVELLVVPIPDKEQVYRDAIPRRYWPGDEPPPAPIVPDLVARFDAAGIPAVSLWPAFERARAGGRPLYWRDDTHWRPEGIALAAELIAKALEGRLDP